MERISRSCEGPARWRDIELFTHETCDTLLIGRHSVCIDWRCGSCCEIGSESECPDVRTCCPGSSSNSPRAPSAPRSVAGSPPPAGAHLSHRVRDFRVSPYFRSSSWRCAPAGLRSGLQLQDPENSLYGGRL